MKRPWIAIVLCLACLAAIAAAEQKFALPEFKTAYHAPEVQYPLPRSTVMEYVDVALLAGALSLASWLALKKRSRRGIYVLMLASLAYFGFYRQGCVCPIGAIQNVTYALCHSDYAIPAAVLAFFLLPIAFTLLFGRSFCAAVCPLGAIQDVVLVKPLNVPAWLNHALGLLAYVYLALAVLFAATGSAFIICQYDPFVSFFRLRGGLDMLILGASFLAMGMFVGRPYCRFLCPYGAILRLVSRVSKYRVKITPQECVQCRLCEESCPFGAIAPTTPAPTGNARRAEGKGLLAAMLVLLPVLTVAAGALGWKLGEPFSRMHSTVRLDDILRMERSKGLEATTFETIAFLSSRRGVEELHRETLEIQDQFRKGGMIAGAVVGFIIGLKLVLLSVRRRRMEYEAERPTCLACGRCFLYCPVEHRRLRELKERQAART